MLVESVLRIGWRVCEGCAFAFALTLLLIPVLNPLARRVGLLDYPGGRKTHLTATPVIGGLAVAVAVFIAILVVCPLDRPTWGLVIGAAILLLVGVLDDLFDLRWYWRMGAQGLAALASCSVGAVRIEGLGALVGPHPLFFGIWSYPLTIFATVGLINALNMVDGLDGLAGLLALCAFAMLGVAGVYAGNLELVIQLGVLSGGLCAFLVFNMRSPWCARARIFLGNSGSAFLGLAIAYASFRLTQTPSHPVTPVLAPFFIAAPVIDCLVLIVRRLRAGRSPFAPDRNHMHHLLLNGGLRPGAIVLFMAGTSVLLGGVSALALHARAPKTAFVIVFALLLVLYFWLSGRPTRTLALCRWLRNLVPALSARDNPETWVHLQPPPSPLMTRGALPAAGSREPASAPPLPRLSTEHPFAGVRSWLASMSTASSTPERETAGGGAEPG